MMVFGMIFLGSFSLKAEKKDEPEAKEVKAQTICPVMGGKINKKFFVDVKGFRIYVCCPGCNGKIKKNPDKYIKKLEKSGVTLEKTPVKKKDEKAGATIPKGGCCG